MVPCTFFWGNLFDEITSSVLGSRTVIAQIMLFSTYDFLFLLHRDMGEEWIGFIFLDVLIFNELSVKIIPYFSASLLFIIGY